MLLRDTLLDLLSDFFRLEGDFLVYDDGYLAWRRSYREVGNAAKACAARLREAGVAKGDRVIIWSENRPEWIAGLYACLLTGAVAVPIDFRSSPEFVGRVAVITSAKLLLRGEEVPASPVEPAWPLTSIEWPDREFEFEACVAARDDLCQIIYTSGATAEPKGVTITHGNLLANLQPVEKEITRYRHYAAPFQPVRILNLLPLSHLFGQVMAAFIPPMIPAQVVFMRGFHPKEIVRQIKLRKISVVVSVPMILDVLRGYVVRAIGGAAVAAPAKAHWLRRWWIYRKLHGALGWKFWAFIVGAAPLDGELEDFWSQRGYVVIQGYGLTETAPIVSLNHPFHASKGSVGKPIAGVEVRIAPDGEILVRGENVSKGYFGINESQQAPDGWLHTGDMGTLDEQGRLHIRGRKKEMIVTPEGLNVFPEDVERILNRQAGVRDSAIIGEHRPHAVLLLDPGVDPAVVVRETNTRLEPHQQVREWTVWPDDALPRTAGTSKLKRREIHDRLAGTAPRAGEASGGGVEEVLAGITNRPVGTETTIDELGLSSLERMELLTRLEGRGSTIDEAAFARARTVGDLRRLAETPGGSGPGELIEFPEWSRSLGPRGLRRVALPCLLLPLARVFAHVKATGLHHVAEFRGPVLFASNHQSHLDLPAILTALPSHFRYRLATAMSREFFQAYFHPQGRKLSERFRYGLEYFLACLFFNGFPLPQREAGTRESLRYMGELATRGWSILIFPEGAMTESGEIRGFQPGVGLVAAKTGLPVVPVRLVGLERVLHRSARFPSPGPVEVRFGAALHFSGTDYAAVAERIEQAVRGL